MWKHKISTWARIRESAGPTAIIVEQALQLSKLSHAIQRIRGGPTSGRMLRHAVNKGGIEDDVGQFHTEADVRHYIDPMFSLVSKRAEIGF